ncbi:hypothetical protein [Snodgrassella sp. CFCC 13594]|uniref:hypothetical protein n=1 Tax=Snodgrassella sp. CFCC 13594 TaxID=1775559 RepID=UPI00082D1EB1|nr:hypothetical protein [Snodgrassella sp. CFCC 13594]
MNIIATVAVPMGEMDTKWVPLGIYQNEADATAAVRDYTANNDYDAWTLVRDCAASQPFYDRLKQRLEVAA